MFEWVLNLYQTVLDGSKDFPQAQAALVTTSSMIAAGGVGFILFKLPKAIGNFFRSQCLTSLVFNTSGTSWTNYNQIQYTSFLKWFSKNAWFNWSRVITLDGESRNLEFGTVGPGVGTHFFIYKKRFFFFKITEKDSQGTSLSKFAISISTIGRSKKPIYDLMDEFMEKNEPGKCITMFDASKDEWNWMTRCEKRQSGTMVIQENVKKELFDALKEFTENREWYHNKGLDYKFCALLYGPPGTGKSSLAREVANFLSRNLFRLSPDGDISYTTLFQKAKGGVVLIEDIDTFGIACKRTSAETDVETGLAIPSKDKDSQDNVGKGLDGALSELLTGSLSSLLNALQGVIPLDDVIVLITSNHPEKLDPALIRDGRIDSRILVDYFTHDNIVEYIKIMYDEDYVGEEFPSLPIATISKHFLENKFSVEGFIAAILSLKENNVFKLINEGN